MRHFYLIVIFFVLLLPSVALAQAVDDNITVDEDSPDVTFSVTDNDAIPGIDVTTVDLDVNTAGQQTFITLSGGTLSVNSSGVVTFNVAADWYGTINVEYEVLDASLQPSRAFINITVNAINDGPTAGNDAATTDENVAATINVLANDSDIDGTLDNTTIDLDPAVGIQTTLSTSDGGWSVVSGQVVFTPAPAFVGVTSISYTVNDNGGATSNAATIQVTVQNVNTPPVAVDDAASTSQNIPMDISILGNDTDDVSLSPNTVDIDAGTPGKQTSITITSGTYTVNASGVVHFAPALNWTGTDSFQYTVNDGDGAKSNAATVTVTVNAVVIPPVAINDAATTNEDTPVNVDVVQNDTDADGTIDNSTVDLDVSALGIQNSKSTSNGTYSVNASGVVTFTPVANYVGNATLQYTVNDNAGNTSNAATITISILAVNDTPVANDDATSTNQNQVTTLNVVTNDTDDGFIDAATVDLDPPTAGTQTTITVTGGNFSVSNSGVVTFSPASNFEGVTTVNYTVKDNQGATSNQASISITVIRINQKPVANADGITTNEDTPASLNILTNDTDDVSLNAASIDLDVNTIGLQKTRTVTAGTFAVDNAGLLVFTPAANYNGTATIRYIVSDNEGLSSDPANITATVNSVNDPPVAVADSKSVNEDNTAVINLLSNDTDVDGTLVAASVDIDPSTPGRQASYTVSAGTFSVNGSGIMTFTPVANFFGTATASYTVADNIGTESNAATITITVIAVNDAPIATNDIQSTDQNVPITFNILANDTDVDGTIDATSVDLNPGVGGIQKSITIASATYSVDNSGNLTFTPVTNFNGTSSITYTVMDNSGTMSNAATISVLVNFVNGTPVANNDAATTNEDTAISFSVVANDTDDGAINAASVDLNQAITGIQNSIGLSQGTLTVNASGIVTFTPVLNYNGTFSTTYAVNDNLGQVSNTATISITVLSVNDAPVAVNDIAAGPENTPLNVSVLTNDIDVDNGFDPSSIDLVPTTSAIDNSLTVTGGTFNVNTSTGVVTFTPTTSWFGTQTITYAVKDLSGATSNAASIKVTINNVNDAPTFDLIPDQRIFRNADTRKITITGISPGPNETESLLISATSSNTSLIPNPTVVYSGTGATAELSFKPQQNQAGTVEITVTAIDEGLKDFSRKFTVTIVEAVITSEPMTVAIVGEPYQYNVTTTELPETLTLEATQKPSWATFTSTGKNTAALAGTTPANATASTVTIVLKDGNIILDTQTFTLLIKHNPVGASFDLSINEDVSVTLDATNFTSGYSDPDADPFESVQFTTLPRHGKILLQNAEVTAGQIINGSSLANLIYQPGLNYSGLDSVFFKVGDQFSMSSEIYHIQFLIAPVNDPPLITNIEAEALIFDIGTEVPKVISPAFDAQDVDSEIIKGATIGLRGPNFDPDHDVLLFSNKGNISGSFDDTNGVLTLTGDATVQEYVEAIRTIQYNFEDPVEVSQVVNQSRTVYFTLTDGIAASEEKTRLIDLIFNFVDLKIPNVFTPDGNGSHEVWPFPTEDGLQQFSTALIRIFNERGKLVHEVKGFANPWDGRKDGVEAPAGIYFYTIDLNYGKIRYNGSLTLLRTEK